MDKLKRCKICGKQSKDCVCDECAKKLKEIIESHEAEQSNLKTFIEQL